MDTATLALNYLSATNRTAESSPSWPTSATRAGPPEITQLRRQPGGRAITRARKRQRTLGASTGTRPGLGGNNPPAHSEFIRLADRRACWPDQQRQRTGWLTCIADLIETRYDEQVVMHYLYKLRIAGRLPEM